MELLVSRNKENRISKVFTFEDKLGDQIWESEPIKRFRFKNMDNEYIKEQLSMNYPTTGIIFNNTPYIGTNDGLIQTPDKVIQRIPEILVDTDIFLDEYPFANDAEKQAFLEYKKKGFDGIDFKNERLTDRIFEIDKLFKCVIYQRDRMDPYLRGYLAIKGFAIDKPDSLNNGEPKLYDGHLLGISNTITGEIINPVKPHTLYQINPYKAGFIPSGYPVIPSTRSTISNGIEERVENRDIDHRSLWDLTGQEMLAEGICPRDGFGYAPAKFATNGEITAISHGDHPWYTLDIFKKKEGIQEKFKSIVLDPCILPQKLLIIDGEVFGDYGNRIRNFSEGEDLFSTQEEISSIADSGLCTVNYKERTAVFNPFTSRRLDSFEGDYRFLTRSPQ